MIPQDGLLVVNGQDRVISEMLKECSCHNIKSYALDREEGLYSHLIIG